MTPHSFFCGRTAAVLFGAPVTPHDELDVAVLAPLRAPRGAGIRGRIVSPHLVEVEVRDGLALTSPAATWAMLARELTERDLVVLGDAFVRIPRDDLGRRQPTQALATLAQLCAAVDAGRRRPKVIRLSAALERIRVGSASPLETEFRLDASTDGLPEAVLDAEIRGESGRLLGISEFAYPRFRTVVEIEGDHHRTSNRQWNRDLAKYRDYADAGWEVVRLTSRNIRGHAPPDATTIVRRVLLRHGWDGRRR
ncbi:MAG: hypothetical protein P0Y60_05955 [Candidatus Microbacterium colombiense]|nr:MAG: hypothetical protein P0Y60_05955 [Microbacterium sp.]